MAVSKIQVTVSHDKYYVWTVEDIMRLRRDHHIMGSLIGCNTRSSFQNVDLGIPLELSRFETQALLNLQLIEIVQVDRTSISPELIESYQTELNQYFEKYKEQALEQRRAKLLENAKEICAVSRKRKKLGDDVTDDQIMAEKLSQLDVPKEHLPVPLHANCPHQGLIKPAEDHLLLRTSMERAKFAIFEQLYKNGFYLTNGFKFSVDFLAYDGDPVVNHARYMVWVTERPHSTTSYELLIKARLSIQVNKTLLMSWIDDDGALKAAIVTWKDKRAKISTSTNLN